MRRGEAMISVSSSTDINHTIASTQQQERHRDSGITSNVALGSSPVWVVPTTNDRQPRAIWRRIFPSWKGSCQPNSNNHNSSAASASSAAAVANSTNQRTIPTGTIPGSDTNMNKLDTNQTIRSDQVNTKSAAPSQMQPVLPPQPRPIESAIDGGQSIPVVSSSSTKTVTTIHPPHVLPPVHRSTTSNTGNNTDTTVTITTTVAATTTNSNKLLPPQSPRMDRPPKLPPSHHQAQRSLTSSLPPPPPPPQPSVVATNMIISSSQPLPQQHRPTAVTNQVSQRNLSFSSTGSRHRRSSGDWPILTSLQQLSLSSPQDDDQLFDTQSLTTTDPQFRSSGSNMNGSGIPPPPPPPPITMIDQPKCERRISILSDFDDDDDHLFDLSSDEDDAEDDNGSNNDACDDIEGAKTKNHRTASSSPNSLTYQRSYDDSCGGNKSKDACSVSPTTVIIPPPPAPVALGDTTATTTAAVSSSSSGTHLTDTPDWMLEWAASASASDVDTPLAQMKKKHDDMFTDQKDDILSAPQEENETASCSTSTVNSCCCHEDASSTEDISMSASDKTTSSEFVYLPIEPIPKVHISANPSTKQKTIFCAGWAIVLWNDVIENRVSSDVSDRISSNQLALPKHHNYDESIYYIELLQGGILRCTSSIGGMDDHSGNTIIEMSLCPCDLTNSRMAASSTTWSIVPVSPATAGACLAIRYTSFHSLPQNRKNDDGGECYLLPVNITTRTMDRIRNSHQRSRLGKNPTIKKTPIVNKPRHNFWLQPQVVVTNESDTNDAVLDVDKSDHYTTSLLQNEYAPQAQHDAVIFLRFALDAALQSSYA